jgi:hypothetical protein
MKARTRLLLAAVMACAAADQSFSRSVHVAVLLRAECPAPPPGCRTGGDLERFRASYLEARTFGDRHQALLGAAALGTEDAQAWVDDVSQRHAEMALAVSRIRLYLRARSVARPHS